MPANYLPFQRLDTYKYVEGTKILSIKSQLQVYLPAGETIEIQEPLELNPFTFYLELWVIPDPTKLTAYLWEGEKLIEIYNRQIYDSAANLALDIRKLQVNYKVDELLANYGSTCYYVTAVVTRPSPYTGGQVTNTISGSGAIDI